MILANASTSPTPTLDKKSAAPTTNGKTLTKVGKFLSRIIPNNPNKILPIASLNPCMRFLRPTTLPRGFLKSSLAFIFLSSNLFSCSFLFFN